MNLDDKIIDRIKKLAAKAESLKEIGNIEEAALFTGKVNELLTEYNLNMVSINTEEMPEVEGQHDATLGLTKRWKIDLLSTLCGYNYCEAIFHRHSNGLKRTKYGIRRDYDNERTVTIVGRPENVDVVKYLFGLLVEQFERMAAKEWKAYILNIRRMLLENGVSKDSTFYKDPTQLDSVTRGYKFKNSFFVGAVHGVNRRLKEQMATAEERHGEQINALVRVNDADVQAYIKSKMGKIGTMRHGNTEIDRAAYNKGVEAGRNTAMARGVAAGESIATKMLA